MKLSMKKIAGLVGVMGLVGATGANAATASSSFQVTATVVASCAVHAGALAFGSITPAEQGDDAKATSEIKVTCSNGTAYNVTLGEGLNNNAEKTQRAMKQSNEAVTDKLNYTLYTQEARTTKWEGAQQVPGVGNGFEQTLTVYGSVPVNQFVASGDYSDTVSVTVAY